MKLTWNNKWIIALLLLLILGNAFFTGMLWKRMHHPPRPERFIDQEPGETMSRILQLDKAQEPIFREMCKKHFARMDTLKSMEYILREKLYAIIDSGKLDTMQMHELSAQLAKVQQQIQEQHVIHFSQLRGICHPEQVVKLKELIHGAVMHDLGPAKFLQVMPKTMRDSLLNVHPDLRRNENPDGPMMHPERPMPDEEGMMPPPPHDHPGPPPPGRPHRPHGPPPPDDEMPPPNQDRPY